MSQLFRSADAWPFLYYQDCGHPKSAGQNLDTPTPLVSVHVNYEETDQLLYVKQQKQTSAQEKHASQLKGTMRQELRIALAGLNRNIGSQMQASHSKMMGAMGRNAAALEANVSVVRVRVRLSQRSCQEGLARVPVPSKPPQRQLRERKAHDLRKGGKGRNNLFIRLYCIITLFFIHFFPHFFSCF